MSEKPDIGEVIGIKVAPTSAPVDASLNTTQSTSSNDLPSEKSTFVAEAQSATNEAARTSDSVQLDETERDQLKRKHSLDREQSKRKHVGPETKTESGSAIVTSGGTDATSLHSKYGPFITKSTSKPSSKSSATNTGSTPMATLAAYSIIEKLGQGTFGVVQKAKSKRTNQLVAIKQLINHSAKEGFPITALREITILKQLNHKNILKINEIIHEDPKVTNSSDLVTQRGCFYTVSPYMSSDLVGLLENPNVNIELNQVKCLMKQLFTGIQYIHEQKFLHRDIKAANILIDFDGILKIADFGLARTYHGDIPKRNSGPGGGERSYTGLVVTRWYRPPELLLGERKYTTAVDLWGIGCVFAELFTHKPILVGNSDVHQAQLVFNLVGPPTNWTHAAQLPNKSDFNIGLTCKRSLEGRFKDLIPADGIDLLSGLLTLDPYKRMNALDALSHGFFTSDPLPLEPFELPRFEESHEIDTKRFKKMKGESKVSNGFGSKAGFLRGDFRQDKFEKYDSRDHRPDRQDPRDTYTSRDDAYYSRDKYDQKGSRPDAYKSRTERDPRDKEQRGDMYIPRQGKNSYVPRDNQREKYSSNLRDNHDSYDRGYQRESRGSWNSKDSRESRNTHDVREPRDKPSQDSREPRGFSDSRRDPEVPRGPKESLNQRQDYRDDRRDTQDSQGRPKWGSRQPLNSSAQELHRSNIRHEKLKDPRSPRRERSQSPESMSKNSPRSNNLPRRPASESLQPSKPEPSSNPPKSRPPPGIFMTKKRPNQQHLRPPKKFKAQTEESDLSDIDNHDLNGEEESLNKFLDYESFQKDSEFRKISNERVKHAKSMGMNY